ncbi:MAG: type II toxin-antitoxin system VapC family toxin [Actinomycetales bacterium]
MTEQVVLAVDTSVAIPLLVASHPEHQEVIAWASHRTLTLSGHAFVETYAVLTRLPGDARVSATDAVRLIKENFVAPLTLSGELATTVPAILAESGVAGGATYDGLVALAALEHRATLVTRDARARSTYEALNVEVRILAI